MKMSKQHFEFIADTIAPLLESATSIEVIADKLEETNPLFNRKVFTDRALKNWEEKNIPPVYVETLDALIEEVCNV